MLKNMQILGLMSGTSLDGLDIALCEFIPDANKLTFKIKKATTLPYTKKWKTQLTNAPRLNGLELLKLHYAYGKYIGEQVNHFLAHTNISANTINAISSHGHTVFHQPANNFTFQTGHGGHIANLTNLPVICDFRLQDVMLGGQGAPLVPIGDRMLFNQYNYCLNIGGIANISLEKNGKRLAWDICPANMVLNYLSQQVDKPFDNNGDMASQGIISKNLLTQLNNLVYYQQKPPKTLGREWVENSIIPIIDNSLEPLNNKLATFTEHIAIQIARSIDNQKNYTMLITGGGAFNQYLITRINKYTNVSVVLPEKTVIEFKEALIFALLGYLKLNNKINVLSSVTGAKKDHISGNLFKI